MMSIDPQEAKRKFTAHFDSQPEVIVRAPARVNIIGEHTDYNEGYVLPMALEQETLILARCRDDRTLNAYAADLERTTQVSLDRLERHPDESWIDYIVGMANELKKRDKPLTGADLMIIGDVPIACGLSSSASLEMATLTMFEALGGFEIEGAEAPKLGRRVENEFLGLSSGIMDQFVSRMAKAGHVLFLDCRSLEYELVPVAFPNSKFVIANTGVSRGLTASKYNERVSECREAVELIKATIGKVALSLRDCDMANLLSCEGALSENVFRRARHVITENERTLSACQAMREGDVERLGKLMNASHESLRVDYEVTCPELDAMTGIARSLEGCYGSRMTGAGFGGCTVSLVEADRVEAFGEELLRAYKDKTGMDGAIIISAPGEGASRIEG
jgi:galactokinase